MKTILVIDDCEADHFIAEETLKKYDSRLSLHRAYDGLDALKFLGEIDRLPDLILLDLNMPRMDGFEFLEEYERIFGNGLIAVLTSSQNEEDKQKALLHKSVKYFFAKSLSSSHVQLISCLDAN